MDGANSSLRSFIELFLLFQIIVIQKEPDHPSFLIDIKSKGTFSSEKEPIGKVWYIAPFGGPRSAIEVRLEAQAHDMDAGHPVGPTSDSWAKNRSPRALRGPPGPPKGPFEA